MIKFFLKGILRDKGRSILPITIIASGVSLTILMSGYIRGVMGDMVEQNANFDTGHLKVMTRAYAIDKDLVPNDLAILGVDSLLNQLHYQYKEIQWVKRIKFGGLLDVPDESGETLKQGPVSAVAIELFNKKSGEAKRLNIDKALIKGSMPEFEGEIVVGDGLFKKLGIKLGEKVTFFGSTMNGSMTSHNFKIKGVVHFGNSLMDNGTIIVDINDAQQMLDMESAAGELLGFFNSGLYDDKKAIQTTTKFNNLYKDDPDEFAPQMFALKEQNNLAVYIDYVDLYAGMFIIMFVFSMSIVLWNTGLLGGLRRFQEFGVRLALGESKIQIYTSLIIEAVLIGIIGSIIGTLLGVLMTLYLQSYGIDISAYMDKATMMIPSVVRAKFTSDLLYIGFIPGVLAIVMGNMLSGLAIYKRNTAQLFKELEV